MIKIKYKVSDEEAGTNTGSGEQPKPGVYTAELSEITVRDNRPEGKSSDLQCVYTLVDDETKKPLPNMSRVWDYVGYEAENTKWKLVQFLEAIGEVGPNGGDGEFDPANHCRVLNDKPTTRTQGTLVKIRIKADSYEGSYKGKVGAVLLHPENTGAGGSDNADPFG